MNIRENVIRDDGDILHHPTMEEKHQKMIERLKENESALNETKRMKKERLELERDPGESADQFWSSFECMNREIREKIEESERDETLNGTMPDSKRVDFSSFALIKARIGDAQEFVARKSYFLAKFDIERAMKECDLMFELVKVSESNLLQRGGVEREKKKTGFSFARSSSSSAAAKMSSNKSSSSKSSTIVDNGDDDGDDAVALLQKKYLEMNTLCVYADLVCETEFVVEACEVDGKDVTIERCKKSSVIIKSERGKKPRSVRMRDCEECEIHAIDIDGSVLVENMNDCTVFVGARQLRIHDSKATRFHCRVASGPIIERCETLEFAPLLACINEGGVQNEGEIVRENLWDKVEDFGWIKTEKSPHWKIVSTLVSR